MVRDLSTLQPTTISGIKSLAKELKRRDGISHSTALDAASRQAGHSSWQAARTAFGAT